MEYLYVCLSMEPLRVTLIQQALCWENRDANLREFSALIAPLAGTTDLIVLPEMFTTGFTMAPQGVAEEMDGPSVVWMQEQAALTGAVLTGSLVIRDEGCYYNRLIWMYPNGEMCWYDKRHLFTLAGEHRHYRAGDQRLIAHWKGWRICPLVCYDLRFPVWSRNDHAYDLLIYVANFPARRSYAWSQLLIARAIENQVYTLGVNRIGEDGNGHSYSGDSALIDYEGQVIARFSNCNTVFTTLLQPDMQMEFQKKFHFLADQDKFFLETGGN